MGKKRYRKETELSVGEAALLLLLCPSKYPGDEWRVEELGDPKTTPSNMAPSVVPGEALRDSARLLVEKGLAEKRGNKFTFTKAGEKLWQTIRPRGWADSRRQTAAWERKKNDKRRQRRKTQGEAKRKAESGDQE
ncbi:hypothetical protein K6V98_08255 [Collinsella sp. AGMB00827]|uniref:Uncharacterized protein n=1 Tax=Collinsella ureilytica TaxID=2869515 RepID=A0ABS7MMR0_9ACTN|nr:hypothetical protein [Collinsella urealyticum]MBY4798336.1 hypothetical protein [Collinsella urealyticum]